MKSKKIQALEKKIRAVEKSMLKAEKKVRAAEERLDEIKGKHSELCFLFDELLNSHEQARYEDCVAQSKDGFKWSEAY